MWSVLYNKSGKTVWKEKNGIVAVSNRIFETQLYDTFLSEMAINEKFDYIGKKILEVVV